MSFPLIPSNEIEIDFARAGGPGGQNVNKLNSKAILRYNLRNSKAFTEDQKVKLFDRIPSRFITNDGCIVIHASEYREQGRNKTSALVRLESLLTESLKDQKVRISTQAHQGSKDKRLDEKKRHGDRKKERGSWYD